MSEIEHLQARVQELEQDLSDQSQKRLENAQVSTDRIIALEGKIRELEQERRWISVKEANLEVWKKYIVLLKNKEGKTYSGLAQYFPSKTVLEEDFISDECYEEESITEYDEENDCYWVREGWFEHTIEGEMEYRLSDEVIMVMPLPQPPKEGE